MAYIFNFILKDLIFAIVWIASVFGVQTKDQENFYLTAVTIKVLFDSEHKFTNRLMFVSQEENWNTWFVEIQ